MGRHCQSVDGDLQLCPVLFRQTRGLVGSLSVRGTMQDLQKTTSGATDLESLLCFALYSVSRQMTNAYRPLLAKLALTYPQYLVLLALGEEDNVTIGTLGSKLYLDFGTLTPLLKRLEERELVTRQRDADDERHVRIKLTAQGKAVLGDVYAVRMELGHQLKLTSSQTASLRRDLGHLMEVLLEVNAAE
jgi:DNA-binding MarR family transcriptional regulator